LNVRKEERKRCRLEKGVYAETSTVVVVSKELEK